MLQAPSVPFLSTRITFLSTHYANSKLKNCHCRNMDQVESYFVSLILPSTTRREMKEKNRGLRVRGKNREVVARTTEAACCSWRQLVFFIHPLCSEFASHGQVPAITAWSWQHSDLMVALSGAVVAGRIEPWGVVGVPRQGCWRAPSGTRLPPRTCWPPCLPSKTRPPGSSTHDFYMLFTSSRISALSTTCYNFSSSPAGRGVMASTLDMILPPCIRPCHHRGVWRRSVVDCGGYTVARGERHAGWETTAATAGDQAPVCRQGQTAAGFKLVGVGDGRSGGPRTDPHYCTVHI
jgi:hypothetical protein